MLSAEEIMNHVNHGHSGDVMYKHGIISNVRYTTEVQYLAQYGDLYWLINDIAFRQTETFLETDSLRDKQIWTLNVDVKDKKALLTCRAYDTEEFCVEQTIHYCNCPVPKLELYCRMGADSPDGEPYMVIMLPREN